MSTAAARDWQPETETTTDGGACPRRQPESRFPAERPKRRLAVILAADVVGYSRLMEQDEAGTLATLKARRREVLEPLVARHRGRIFKIAGDSALAEFGSAVGAVQCAIDLQREMASANDALSDERSIVLRIGVNLGDVIVEGSDLYGDGVNIAARLEGMAEPGGILVSGTAYDHVRNKVSTGFDDLGVRNLKNIREPVRVFAVSGISHVRAAAVTADKPSIAILPFVNMSGDPGQTYFSDGVTEDIITELSRFPSLFVVARNSSFQYRDKAVDVRRIALELGVRYLVEGSVRKAANRVRITAQLIDAANGSHLWSERYDRSIDGLFEVQDEVTRTIVATLVGRVEAAEMKGVRQRPTDNLHAYEALLRGIEHLRGQGDDDNRRARELFESAVALDPRYGLAHAYVPWLCSSNTGTTTPPISSSSGLSTAHWPVFGSTQMKPDATSSLPKPTGSAASSIWQCRIWKAARR